MAMNLTDSWQRLSECIAPQPLVAGDAAGEQGTWNALFGDRPRPLLLPAHNRRARRCGVRFFLPELWRQYYARARLRAHDLFGASARLPALELPIATLAQQLDITESPQWAVLIGTPGPYQKASMLAMSSQGEPLALVKLAMGSNANEMIGAEAAWLRTLNAQPSMSAAVPRLLQAGHARNERRYLVQSIVPGRPDGGAFTAAHADFLQRLGAIDCRQCALIDAPVYAVMNEHYRRLKPQLTAERVHLLQGALDECERRLHAWRGPFVISHGDFAAWNMRVSGDTLCVFDWEYAFAGVPPLFDLLHFHLIAPANSGRLLSARDMRRALAPAKAFALLAYPDADWSGDIVSAIGLGYLLHTLLFYGESRGELPESHPVVRSYCRLIEERASWRL